MRLLKKPLVLEFVAPTGRVTTFTHIKFSQDGVFYDDLGRVFTAAYLDQIRRGDFSWIRLRKEREG